jgi:hypothetical protein
MEMSVGRDQRLLGYGAQHDSQGYLRIIDPIVESALSLTEVCHIPASNSIHTARALCRDRPRSPKTYIPALFLQFLSKPMVTASSTEAPQSDSEPQA